MEYMVRLSVVKDAECDKQILDSFENKRIGCNDDNVESQPGMDVVDLIKVTSGILDGTNNICIPVGKLMAYIVVTSEVTQKPLTIVGKSFEKIFERMAENIKTACDDTRISDRDFGSVLDGIAAEWESYDPFKKVEISRVFAGERCSEDFRVLMENYEAVYQYLESGSNEVI